MPNSGSAIKSSITPTRLRSTTGARYRPATKPMTTLGSAAMISTVGLIRARMRRVHELRGVERAEDGERDGEHERVERALDRAEDERHQADLRLEIVGGAGGLPDVLGLGIALVPDLAEQRVQTRFGMRIGEREPIDLAAGAGDEQAVALRGHHEALDRARARQASPACGRTSDGEGAPDRRRRRSQTSGRASTPQSP